MGGVGGLGGQQGFLQSFQISQMTINNKIIITADDANIAKIIYFISFILDTQRNERVIDTCYAACPLNVTDRSTTVWFRIIER